MAFDNKKIENVDACVIMACGMGKRMAPLTYDTPKCMIIVNGEPLIERQIKQIIETGIKEIYIVVGYLFEKFKYLEEKFGVKLIFNENSKTTNTLHSLNCALPYITNKNVYLSYADIYMSENIFKNIEHGSHFKGKYFAGENDEWDLTLNECDEILKIDKHGKDSYCMVGIAYFNKYDLNVLTKYAKELLNDDESYKFYWEEVLYRYIESFKGYYLEKINDNVLIEYDDYVDFFNYVKTNNTITGCYSYNLICKTFNTYEKDIELVKCIEDGITNRKYVFNIKNNNKKFIMRVPGGGSEKFINRKIEVEAINRLKEYNAAENVIFVDPNTGYKIAEFYDDAKTIDTESSIDLKNAMKAIVKLHNSGINISKNKNLFDFIDCHREIILKYKFKHPFNDEDSLKNQIDEIINMIKSYNRKDSFCHGDASPTNMLKTNSGIKFIDLEYVMMFDPLFEISMFALNSGFDEFGALKLLEYYIEVDKNNFVIKDMNLFDLKKLIVCYYILSQYYSYLWAITFQHFNSIDYTELLKVYHEKTLNGIFTLKKEYM